MVNVSNHALVLMPSSSLIDSKKGSIGNRAECAVKQGVQKVKDAVVFGAAAGAAGYGYHKINQSMKYGVYDWNTKFNDALKKGLSKLNTKLKIESMFSDLSGVDKNGKLFTKKSGTTYKNMSIVKGEIHKVGIKIFNKIIGLAEKLSKTSGRQKVLGVFGTVAAIGLLHLAKKQGFKRGQIDQKYNDRANLEKIVD